MKKSKMAQIVGGTTTTTMKQVGAADKVTENEYWDSDKEMKEEPIPVIIDSDKLG